MSISTITNKGNLVEIPNNPSDAYQIGYAIGYQDGKRDAASPWHRVEDELPESGEFGKIVLACNDVGTVNAAFLSSSGKWYAANNTMYDAWTWMPNVTHWMPIPEPPKGTERRETCLD